jgi:hypothetical protein
VKEGERER